jgi:hypothetical protein
MKKKQNYLLFLVAVAMAGCNGLGKMAKNANLVKYEVTPNPLVLQGDSVALSVKGTYPAKYFAKKVALTVTPVLKTANGDKPFTSLTTEGENLKGAGTTINMKTGGNFTYNSKIAYTPDMRASDVMLNIKGTQGTKSQDFPPMKIADATIATQALVKNEEKVIVGKDNFVRITPANFSSEMYYSINNSNVNEGFNMKKIGLNNKAEFHTIDSILKGFHPGLVLKGVDIMGNASPDGKMKINTPLAEKRSKSSEKYLNERAKKLKMPVDAAMIHTSSTSEDWPGFQKLMSASDIAMKDVVLRIVASNSDPDARNMEIKKMGKAFTEIAEKIMPKLRKSDITFNADKVGRSDDQISALALSNPDSLNVEEILYAGGMQKDMDKKLTIYKSAERIYPQDWRAANNAGMVMFMQGNADGAMTEFQKADQLKAGNPIVQNNLGACYSHKNDRKKAAEMYAAASGAGNEVMENMAILDIKNGNYSAAVSHEGDAKTFNAALAKLLAGDKDGAKSTIESSPDNTTASGYYLKAVISARKGDASGVISNLKNSIEKDASMKAFARDDREFIKWFADNNFKSVVQ